MKYEELLDLADKEIVLLTKEIELKNGKKLKFNVKNYLEVSEIRACAKLIANSCWLMPDKDLGETLIQFDYSLYEINRVFTLISILTDLDVEGVHLEDYINTLNKLGILETIMNSLDFNLVDKIDDYVDELILEKLRVQELEGQLGYAIKDILMNFGDEAENLKNILATTQSIDNELAKGKEIVAESTDLDK